MEIPHWPHERVALGLSPPTHTWEHQPQRGAINTRACVERDGHLKTGNPLLKIPALDFGCFRGGDGLLVASPLFVQLLIMPRRV